MKVGYVYKLTDHDDTYSYIGSTTLNINRRYQIHRTKFRRGINDSQSFKLMSLFGENLKCELLEEVEYNDIKELLNVEYDYIRSCHNCINKKNNNKSSFTKNYLVTIL